MITRDNLPQSFKPFQVMTVCSNSVIGGSHLVSIGNVLPLLIGQGPKPLVWLQAATDPKAENFVTVVEASISRHPAVRVIEDQGEIRITAGNTEVLKIISTEPESIVIETIDLRPLGINIHGDASGLTAGGMSFTRSTFNGIGTVIAFGGAR